MKCTLRLSDLESMLIDDGVDTRDKWRGEDNFPLKDSESLRIMMRDDLSLDMERVGRNLYVSRWPVCFSHSKFCLILGRNATTKPSLDPTGGIVLVIQEDAEAHSPDASF